MSINNRNDDVQINKEGTMVSVSTIQQSNESFNKINIEDGIKQQLAYLHNRRPAIQSRTDSKVQDLREEQMESNLKLLKFVADSQLTLTQVNGQRKLGPPPGWTGPPPGPKCEIFVGSIPRDYYEPEIVPIFSTVGTIYELRLMMEFSGINRGYCFIMYTTEEEAARAVKELDQHEIYPGKRIGVVASTNNCRLYINQLPRNLDSKTIIKKIYEMTDEIDKVAVYRNFNGFVCYVLVSYKTHRGAAMARRRLVPESAMLFKNCEVNIEWANANMAPFNVYEESGTCDEEGNIVITETFIEPIKTKKVAVRAKQKAIKHRPSNTINNQRMQKSIDTSVHKGRPIKAASSNSLKSLDNPSQCKFEKCRSKSLVCYNCCSLVELARKKYKSNGACDINGNLRNSLDHSLPHEHSKQNCAQPDHSKAVLPAISTYLTYLNKGKRLKNLKWNELQRCSNDALGSIQDFSKNLKNIPSDLINNYRLECSCHCQFHGNGSFNSPTPSSNDFQSVNDWNSTDSFVKDFSKALNISNESDSKNCVRQEHRSIYKSKHIPVETNVRHVSNNFLHSRPLNESNRQLANGHQYSNCYQNFAINTAEQINGTTYDQFRSQNLLSDLQNVQELTAFRQEPNREHFSQQFPLSDVKPMMINQNFSWFSPELLPMEVYRRESVNISGVSNKIVNDCKYLNNH
ncbi:uncharacterized protein LOC110119175 [Bombus terrestris]|uniref:Uncharacterized protein LOC110119175 n=1 Tax=Bombus terrestris TaxID=30195 RepID=A0A9B7I0G6_BOMTE|nr:uncharacterized protein LOC110119175 [Bombus terrestris]